MSKYLFFLLLFLFPQFSSATEIEQAVGSDYPAERSNDFTGYVYLKGKDNKGQVQFKKIAHNYRKIDFYGTQYGFNGYFFQKCDLNPGQVFELWIDCSKIQSAPLLDSAEEEFNLAQKLFITGTYLKYLNNAISDRMKVVSYYGIDKEEADFTAHANKSWGLKLLAGATLEDAIVEKAKVEFGKDWASLEDKEKLVFLYDAKQAFEELVQRDPASIELRLRDQKHAKLEKNIVPISYNRLASPYGYLKLEENILFSLVSKALSETAQIDLKSNPYLEEVKAHINQWFDGIEKRQSEKASVVLTPIKSEISLAEIVIGGGYGKPKAAYTGVRVLLDGTVEYFQLTKDKQHELNVKKIKILATDKLNSLYAQIEKVSGTKWIDTQPNLLVFDGHHDVHYRVAKTISEPVQQIEIAKVGFDSHLLQLGSEDGKVDPTVESLSSFLENLGHECEIGWR